MTTERRINYTKIESKSLRGSRPIQLFDAMTRRRELIDTCCIYGVCSICIGDAFLVSYMCGHTLCISCVVRHHVETRKMCHICSSDSTSSIVMFPILTPKFYAETGIQEYAFTDVAYSNSTSIFIIYKKCSQNIQTVTAVLLTGGRRDMDWGLIFNMQPPLYGAVQIFGDNVSFFYNVLANKQNQF